MNRLALALIVAAASVQPAAAGTYLGLGIGTPADASSAQVGVMDGAARSGRVLLGTRVGRIALEGQAARFDLTAATSRFEATQLGAGLKLSHPLGDGFELFARGGVARTWLSGSLGDASSGRGWFAGGGVEYRLNLVLAGASLFVDYQRSAMTFGTDRMTEQRTAAGMWTVGATVSI